MIYLLDRLKSIQENCRGKTLDLGSAEGNLHEYLKRKLNGKLIGLDIKKTKMLM